MTNGTLRDARQYLEEDMLVYGGFAVLNLAWDFLFNLAVAVNLHTAPHEPNGHPYSLGAIQIIALLFCMIQFARKWNHRRYT